MIRTPASPARLGAGLPAPGFGPWLVAFACGFAAMVLVALATAQAGAPASVPTVRTAVAVMSAGEPAKTPVMLKLDRDGTAIAADIELLADPAMPGPTFVVVPAPGFVAAAFREVGAAPPPSAPAASPLRPPRAA